MGDDPRVSVDAWRSFCEALADAGELVLRAPGSDQPGVAAEGIRALSRYAALGLERAVEIADPDRPAFLDLQTPIRKYMGDNPDQTYRTATIAGDRTYRIADTIVGAVAVEIAVYAGSFGAGGRRLVAATEDGQLETAVDGSYEIYLSPEPGEGNALLLEPDASSVLIRTYFDDLATRLRHPMPTIERIPPAAPAPMLTDEQLNERLEVAALFTAASFAWWVEKGVAQATSDDVNTLPAMADEGDLLTPDNVRYLSGYWNVAPDEALVVDVAADDSADYWSVVLMTPWGESVEWRERTAVINNRTAVPSADGTVRFVIAHSDPGLPNWLDTAGHCEGTVALRWFRSTADLPAADTTLVKLADVSSL